MHLLGLLFLFLLCVPDSWQSHRIKRVPMNASHIDLDFGLVTEDVCSDPTAKPKKDKLKANVVGLSETADGEDNLQHLALNSAKATPIPKPLIRSDEALNSVHPEGSTASSLTPAVLQDTKKFAKHVAKSSGGGRHHKKKHDHHHAKEEKKRAQHAMDEMLTKSFRDMLTKVFAKNNALGRIDGGVNGNAMNDKDNNKHITNMSNRTDNDNGHGNGNANTHRSAAVTVNGNGESNSNNATKNNGNNNANNRNNVAAAATIVIDVGIKTHKHNKSPADDGVGGVVAGAGGVGGVVAGGGGAASLAVGAPTSGILTLPLIGKETSKYEQQLERELERQQQQQQEEKQQRLEGHEHEAPPPGTTIDLQQIPLAKFNPSDGYLQFSKLHLYTLDGKPIRAQRGQISINANPFANMPPSGTVDDGGDLDTIDYLFNSEMVPAAPFAAVPRGGLALGPPSLRAVGYAAPGSPINEFPLSRPWHYYQGSGAAAAPVPPMPSVNFIENALDLLLASKMAANGDDNESADTEVELFCPVHRDPKRTSPEISGDSGKCTVNGGASQDGGLVCSCRFIKNKHVP